MQRDEELINSPVCRLRQFQHARDNPRGRKRDHVGQPLGPQQRRGLDYRVKIEQRLAHPGQCHLIKRPLSSAGAHLLFAALDLGDDLRTGQIAQHTLLAGRAKRAAHVAADL